MVWADRTPQEQAAINYCVPKGIPYTVFLGRVVYHGDPQWTADDRTAVVDWLIDQDNRCQDCGASLNEALAEDNAYEYRAEALWCHGCRAMHRAAIVLAGGGKENPLAGARYRFTRTPKGRSNGDVDITG